MSEFDASEFMERVDYISVGRDKMLAYHFRDGKIISRKYEYTREKNITARNEGKKRLSEYTT